MRNHVVATFFFLAAVGLCAQGQEGEARKFLRCLDIVNQYVEEIDSGVSQADKRLVIYSMPNGKEYRFDGGITLRRLERGAKLEFSMGPTGMVGAELDFARKTFSIWDKNGARIGGSFTVKSNGRIGAIEIKQGSSLFKGGDLEEASTNLFNSGIIMGFFIISY